MSPRVSAIRYPVWQRSARLRVRENVAGSWADSRQREAARLKAAIEAELWKLHHPQLFVNGRRIDDVDKAGLALSCAAGRVTASFRLASTVVRRRVVAMSRDSFGALALRTEAHGGSELIELRPGSESPSSGSLKELRRQFQVSVETLIARAFPRTTMLRSVVYSDLARSLSGKYVRLRFRSGASEWQALAVSPWEEAAAIDGILSSGLLWRDYLQGKDLGRCERLLLIAPSDKLLVLKSRLAWIRGAGRKIHLMGMELEKGALSFVDLGDCGNLDTALTQVQTVDRFAQRRSGDAGHRSGERLLESLTVSDIRRIDSRLDSRFVYPQVPAFLSGDRGMIDVLSVTNQGRLAVLELKVSEDIDLPMQGLDYWLRVRWHHLRQEFDKKGYFPGVPLSPELPLLFFVCPQFRYHSSFPRIAGQIDPSVPMLQVGINEDWSRGIQVVLKRALNSSLAPI